MDLSSERRAATMWTRVSLSLATDSRAAMRVEAILRRLIARYGSNIVIAQDGNRDAISIEHGRD
jgi:hypothetical protein